MPYMSSGSFLGLAVEVTDGVPVAPTLWIPVKSPQVAPMVTWLKDESLRGSPVETYGNVAGIRHDTYDCKGDAYLDTFPNILRAALGSTDTLHAAPTNTTLAALCTAGATTISTTATIAAGKWFSIDTGALIETHKCASVTGAGPFTVTLSFPTLYGHASAAAVTGLTGHVLSVLNNAATGSQPPSYTITDFDGAVARQLAGGQLDTLSMDFASGTSLAWTAKYLAFPFTNVATPTTESFSTELFVPGYSCTVAIAGAVSKVVTSGSIAITRNTAAIETANNAQQIPYQLWAGPIGVTGKLTFVIESGDTTLTNGTTSVKQAVNLIFTNPQDGNQLVLQMSQVQLQDPKIERGKAWVEVSANFVAESNATDALLGYAPIEAFVANQQTTAY